MKIIKHIIFIIIVFCSFSVNASVNQALLDSANATFKKGLYKEAENHYLQIIDSGEECFELYYNLGNTYYRLNEIPAAILYFEKAKRINPSDEDLLFNLNVTKIRITDKIEDIPELFYQIWWKNLYSLFSVDDWATITIFLFCITLLFILSFLLFKTVSLRKGSFYLSVILLAITVLTYILGNRQHHALYLEKEAIVFYPTVTVKSSPDKNSADLFVIHEGLKVKITDDLSDWFEIKIPDGSKGWIPSKHLRKI